jgi:hypothetical protein
MNTRCWVIYWRNNGSFSIVLKSRETTRTTKHEEEGAEGEEEKEEEEEEVREEVEKRTQNHTDVLCSFFSNLVAIFSSLSVSFSLKASLMHGDSLECSLSFLLIKFLSLSLFLILVEVSLAGTQLVTSHWLFSSFQLAVRYEKDSIYHKHRKQQRSIASIYPRLLSLSLSLFLYFSSLHWLLETVSLSLVHKRLVTVRNHVSVQPVRCSSIPIF